MNPDDLELTLNTLRYEVDALRRDFDEQAAKGPVLGPNLDPQTDLKLEEKFSIHSAHGRSHKSSTQSINDASATKVVWEVNDWVQEMVWDSTNNRFKILRAGRYLVAAAITYTATTVDKNYQALIYKNGAEVARASLLSNATASSVLTSEVTDTVDLLAGDYIEIYAFHDAGLAKNIGGANHLCRFNILRID